MVAAACGTSSGTGDTEPVVPPSTEATTTSLTEAPQDETTTTSTEVVHEDETSEETAAVDDHMEDDHMEEAEDGGVAMPSDRTVEVSMTEMAFSPESVEVTAGETITFVVSNDGVTLHEFRLSNAHRIEEHLASGHEDHDEDGDHHGDVDVVLELEAGERGEVTVTFPEDDTLFTEVACLIPGHYEAGMKGHVIYE